MIRRMLVIAVFVVLALACAAAPALAYGPTCRIRWTTTPAGSQRRPAQADRHVVRAPARRDRASAQGSRYSSDGAVSATRLTVVAGITALERLVRHRRRAPRHRRVEERRHGPSWRSDVSTVDGRTPGPVCTDAAAATLVRRTADVVPAGVAADGQRRRLHLVHRLARRRLRGYTSSTTCRRRARSPRRRPRRSRSPRAPSPRLDADDDGHAFACSLAGPQRSGRPALTPLDWRATGASPMLALSARSLPSPPRRADRHHRRRHGDAVLAWREGAQGQGAALRVERRRLLGHPRRACHHDAGPIRLAGGRLRRRLPRRPRERRPRRPARPVVGREAGAASVSPASD